MLNSKITFILLLIIVGILLTKNLEKFTIPRKSKCFSCEKQIIRNQGIMSVWNALPSKCFSCEKQFKLNKKNNFKLGPNKCYDCEEQILKNTIKHN